MPLVAQPGLAPSPVSSTGQALRQERRGEGSSWIPTPRRGRRVSNPPLQSRATRCGVALGSHPHPNPLPQGELGPFPPPHCSVVWLPARYRGGERPGCVESMGAPWGSGSCQCCLRVVGWGREGSAGPWAGSLAGTTDEVSAGPSVNSGRGPSTGSGYERGWLGCYGPRRAPGFRPRIGYGAGFSPE